MGLWAECVFVVLLAVGGGLVGVRLSRYKAVFWMSGVAFCFLILIGLIGLSYFGSDDGENELLFLTMGRPRFMVLALVIPMAMTILHCRTEKKIKKAIIALAMVSLVAGFTIMPFLMPAVLAARHLGIDTRFDSNGICIQSTKYTCGPAAAVTALRRLGFDAQEGDLTVLSRTSPTSGTLVWDLCRAIKNKYGREGVQCNWRRFETVEQLKDCVVTLVIMKEAFMLDHWVAVLEVSDEGVLIADPSWGRRRVSQHRFANLWRNCGIVLDRSDSLTSQFVFN